jgi:hypothetical protein
MTVLPVVTWPNALQVTLDYLSAAGVSARFAERLVQGTLPLVVARRAGGVASSLIVEQPRVDVHCYGADDTAAHDLAQTCRGLLLAAAGTGAVRRVTQTTGLLSTPDDDWKQAARVWFSVELTLRGAAA